MSAEDYMPDDLGLDQDTEDGNPNNCSTCNHKKRPDGGWCYMFRTLPHEICYRHTGRDDSLTEWRKAIERLSRT